MKRGRNARGQFTSGGGSVTGGTGDIKPQIMTVTIPTPGAIDDYSVQEFTTPRLVMGGQDFTTVMEILKVYWFLGIADLGDENNVQAGYLAFRQVRAINETSNFGTLLNDFERSDVFAAVMQDNVLLTSGSSSKVLPITVDLTDGNGNGVLIATDKLFAHTGAVDNTASSGAAVKILYRMVNIGIQEYVGIVQSQSI